MCYAKIYAENVEKLRTNWHKGIDKVCDNLESQREDQVGIAMQEMENQLNEDLLDTMEAFCQENNQEQTPLLLREQQELLSQVRCRIQKSSGPDPQIEGPEAQQPREGFCQQVLRCFQGLLQRLRQTWQDVLTWVKEKMAAVWNKVKALWNVIESFCSSVVKEFPSLFQV